MKFSMLALTALLATLEGCVDAHSLAKGSLNTTNSTFDVLDYVDPLIGTANGG